MKKEILGFNKQKIGEINLGKNFTDSNLSHESIYYKVMNENANIHIGTAFKKNRTLVNGGGAKPWRQKGMGRARAGTKRSPIFKGGGVAFGNQRKKYKFKLPGNIKKVSLLSIFKIKFDQDLVTVIDNFILKTPRIKEFNDLVKNVINIKEKSILVVADTDENMCKAIRNIENIKLVSVKRIVLRDFLNDHKIFVTKDAVEYLNNLDMKISSKKKEKKEVKEVKKAPPARTVAKKEPDSKKTPIKKSNSAKSNAVKK